MPQFSVPRNNFISTLFLLQNNGIQVNTVMEMGAAEGIYLIERLRLGLFSDAKHVFIDCMEENVPTYQHLSKLTNCDYVIGALSDTPGEAEILVDPMAYNTRVASAQDTESVFARTYSKRTVQRITLDDVVAERGLSGPFYLHLDLQGGELTALRGARKTLAETAIVVSELQIYGIENSFVKFSAEIGELGFRLFDITSLAYTPSANMLYQVYATFLRSDLDFRLNLPWATGQSSDKINQSLRDRRQENIRNILQIASITPTTSDAN